MSADSISYNTYNHKTSTFSGLVIFTTLNNKFVNGWKYELGKIVGKAIVKKPFFDRNAPFSIPSDYKKNKKNKTSSLRPQPIEEPIENDGGGGGGANCGTKVVDWYSRTCWYSGSEKTCTDWVYTGSVETTTICDVTITTGGSYISGNGQTTIGVSLAAPAGSISAIKSVISSKIAADPYYLIPCDVKIFVPLSRLDQCTNELEAFPLRRKF